MSVLTRATRRNIQEDAILQMEKKFSAGHQSTLIWIFVHDMVVLTIVFTDDSYNPSFG
jgi:hypothetical protein